MRESCRLCGGDDLTRIYEVDDVPVQSCVLLEYPDLAAAYPTGLLRLDACGACGFVQNSAFDPGLVDYSQPYEEAQTCSPTFREFSDDLTARLAARLSTEAHVLEVGCGKGDFLAGLCAVSGATGLGLDPSYDPARRPSHAPPAAEYRAEHFDAASSESADLVVCRHTLEHIADVTSFTRWLAGAMREGGRVFLEVPDADRILDQGAFEDIYYEHCSYFTMKSLRHLLHRAGLQELDLRLEYGGQYLTVLAAVGPSDVPSPPARDVGAFVDTVDRQVAAARATLAAAQRPVVWGAGSKAVSLLSAVGPEVAARVTATDINPVKWDTCLPGSGQPVVAPTALQAMKPDVVLVVNPLYVDEVTADLSELGLAPQVVPIRQEPSTARR